MICLTLFLTFFRIGIFSFGGGLAMLPLIFQTVQDFGFMSAEDFSNLVALSQITPGPIAVNAATYVGFSFAGFPGAVCATIGVGMPSFILIIIVIKFLDRFNNNKGIEAAFIGIRPATVGLIAAAAVFVGQTTLVNVKNSFLFRGVMPIINEESPLNFIQWIIKDILSGLEIIPCIVFIATVILAGKFKMNPIKIIMIMAVVGVTFCS